MKLIALIVQSLLWLAIAASPTIAGVIVGLILSMQAGDLYSLTVPLCGFVGFVFGGVWAERIRKTIGLSSFFGKLMGMPEAKIRDKDAE